MVENSCVECWGLESRAWFAGTSWFQAGFRVLGLASVFQARREVNLSPDHLASKLLILKSTMPASSPALRTTGCERSVVSPEPFLGQAIHRAPLLAKGVIRRILFSSSARERTNQTATSAPV